MQYFGGKARISKKIAEFLNEIRAHEIYFEPFCGSCWVAHRIDSTKMVLSDANTELIYMWQMLQGGWIPPDFVSEETYALAKRGLVTPQEIAFIGFGCSYSGKCFGGYARDGKGRNYAKNAKNSLLKKLNTLKQADFIAQSYTEFNPRTSEKRQIYCDPPYANTTQYDRFSKTFDSEKFWGYMRLWSRCGHDVYVSEYSAPNDFKSVLTIETRTDIRNKKNELEPRIEKLFQYRI